MPIDDAHVHVWCGRCGCEGDPITLTSIAGNRCWDERNVGRELERGGWRQDGDDWICDSCVSDDKEKAAEDKEAEQ